MGLIEDFQFDRLYRSKKEQMSENGALTPALMKPYDEHWLFSKTLLFSAIRKLNNNCNKLPQIPLRHK